MLDYIRIACAVPPVKVADVIVNTQDICDKIAEAENAGCDVVVFPELALTGYTCADLFFQSALLNAAVDGLSQICEYTKRFPSLTVAVGAPLLIRGQMYNCGIVISDGIVRGIVPKTYLPNYKEFYERRWFSSSYDLMQASVHTSDLGLVGEYDIPVGRNLLFKIGDGTLMGVEICEDLWSPMPPSTMLALNGAEVILNLSASNETVGKRAYRRDLVKHQSSMCNCIYAFCSAGYTESTQDLVFSGHSLIAENGNLLFENKQDLQTDYLLVQDADLGKIRAERRKNKSVRDATTFYGKVEPACIVDCRSNALRSDGALYNLNKLSFVPADRQTRMERCSSIFNIQVTGLAQRLKAIGANAVVGISGGLDSTLALLVAVEAMRRLGRPMTDVYGVTMPCFGTSDRTYQNAWELMKVLGISAKEISIKDAVNTHFRDIGHDPGVFDTTYENAQARERTQVLMDYAGEVGGIVVGTGDLSELALGWCTYNGDHMSMYSVNASVPKTLIRWIIANIAEDSRFAAARDVLMDILDTPISPELLPPDETGKISQQTEDLVGPYALHDFFLYNMLRFDFTPKKIYTMACRAFRDDFDTDTVKKWLKVFYRRFFTQQFKRSCMPDGVKVGHISVSPRGDWKMPSDAVARVWLDEVDKL
ncbi:MAG: NAD(+) synthase [Oscillospiraceae bacterium]|nr:NAD(+) synthase [Oscillospiraceae bacterium]